MIEHTVMWKFLPGKEDEARRFLDALAALERYKNDPRHVAVSAMCREIRAARYAIDCEK